jgi:hypothetical protein
LQDDQQNSRISFYTVSIVAQQRPQAPGTLGYSSLHCNNHVSLSVVHLFCWGSVGRGMPGVGGRKNCTCPLPLPPFCSLKFPLGRFCELVRSTHPSSNDAPSSNSNASSPTTRSHCSRRQSIPSSTAIALEVCS